jgi:uncharacterized protein (TIGR02246 family)
MNRQELTAKMHELVHYFHQYDLEGATSMFAENATAVHFNGTKGIGRPAIKEIMRPFFAKEFGEMHFTVLRVDVDEPANVAWSVWLMKLTKDGASTTIEGVDTFEFQDGLIVRNSVYVKSEQPLVVLG